MVHLINFKKLAIPKPLVFCGAPDTIRTYDLCLRRATLYPAELRVHEGCYRRLLACCLCKFYTVYWRKYQRFYVRRVNNALKTSRYCVDGKSNGWLSWRQSKWARAPSCLLHCYARETGRLWLLRAYF